VYSSSSVATTARGNCLAAYWNLRKARRRGCGAKFGLDVAPTRLTGVYKNMKLGVVALVFRARVVSGTPTTTEESAAVAWWTADQIATDMTEAFAVRILDALRDDTTPAVRIHDGQRLLDAMA
jgi:8-oxo-dGTP diphosphatase